MSDNDAAGDGSTRKKNFFNTVQRNFPEVLDGKLDTHQFLESSKDVVVLVDLFGTLFASVKYDMNGNIEKLTQRFNIDRERFQYLDNLIVLEKAEGGSLSVDALLWLRRALHFIHTFLQCILNDFEEGKKTEDLVPFLKKAYKDGLEQYHGWMLQQLFKLICRMCPSRTTLLETLSLGEVCSGEQELALMRDMKLFLMSLRTNMQHIIDLYETHSLDSNSKV